MHQTRNRLVNFRVTDEEFQVLKTASSQRNARCLSEFARSIVLRTAQSGDAGPSVDDRILAMDRRLALLESNVARLYDALAHEKAAHAKT